jgi:chromosome segregation protein
VVTRAGDYLSPWLVTGGSDSGASTIQLAAALAEAQAQLATVDRQLAEAERILVQALARAEAAEAGLAQAVRTLNESDAAQSAALEQLSRLGQTRQLLRADAGRLSEQAARAGEDLDHDQAAMAELQARLAAAESTQEVAAPDPADRDAAAETARRARAGEMEARLGLRTVEERVRSLAGQAETLRRTAESERSARAAAERRRGEMLAQAAAARAVAAAGQWLLDRVDQSAAAVERERAESGEARTRSEAAAEAARIRVRDLAAQLEALVDSHHRDELARAQQKMRIDALAERALAEAGLDAATLMSQYGPDQLIPGDVPGPYARDEQLRRLRTAERDLQLLGKINPLALEEFDAMQERHTFLATQLEDLKKTRADLLSIVDDVDARVQEVFAAAYQDVEREFAALFARLFPGGEGRLLLTAPGEWLTTGIEVEARPAGKKVKRLSLLSGGERSLVAVCFLVALFKARPSPFYILDEVEAALDDTNLGRLLDVYEELRADSQLLVITHQKRTMEIADTLYGVTMGSDGTSTVVSQRLREE